MAKGDPCKWCGEPVNAPDGKQCGKCKSRRRNKEKTAARQRCYRLADPERFRSHEQRYRERMNPEILRRMKLEDKRAAALCLGVAPYRKMLADPNYHPDDDDE